MTIDWDDLLRLAEERGLGEQELLSGLGRLLDEGRGILRQDVAGLDLPAWVVDPPNDISLRRLLDGQRDVRVASTTVPGFGGLGDQRTAAITTGALIRLSHAVAAHVGAVKVAQHRKAGRRAPSYQPDDYGHGAQRTFVQVTKRVFAELHRRHLILEDPATGGFGSRSRLREPGPQCPRYAIEQTYLDRILMWIEITRADPELDRLIIELALHTGARREGLLDLALSAIDVRNCLLGDTEKYGKSYLRPVKRSLLRRARDLAMRRGAVGPADLVLPRRDGRPVTTRYLDGLFSQVQQSGVLPAGMPVSLHWLRHTCLTRIREAAGYFDAEAWAGHAPSALGTTARYVGSASLAQLRKAAEATFGPLEDEPLVPTTSTGGV